MHKKAVKRIVRYLKTRRREGIYLRPTDKSFGYWVNADFCGLWNRKNAQDDPSTAKSRTGYVVTYAGCPIVWASKLQTDIALSTTETEYIALSQALREVIPLMHLLREFKNNNFHLGSVQPTVHCRVFEDNAGALELANVPKMRPRTKHINVKYHHFREYVTKGDITVLAVSSEEQVADMLTKPLSNYIFQQLRMKLLGW